MQGNVFIEERKLKGNMKSEGKLIGHIRTNTNLRGKIIITTNQTLYEDYTGDYIVTPEINSKTIHTKDKHMIQDVIVEGIPYYEVDNEYSGQTVIIGG